MKLFVVDVKTNQREALVKLTIFLGVRDDLVGLLVRFVSEHGDLQGVDVGVLVLDHLAEEHPGGASLVGVLVVHRVLLAVVLAVLGQHLWEHNVTLVPVKILQ